MLDGDDSVTVRVLEAIRDEIKALRLDTNARFEETHQRMDRTNERLDFLNEGQVRLSTEVAGVKGQVIRLNETVEKNGERFEHFLLTQGDTVRELKDRLTRVETHLRLPPLKP